MKLSTELHMKWNTHFSLG